jgi:hypothetical protein
MTRALIAITVALTVCARAIGAPPDATLQLLRAKAFCIVCEVAAGRSISADHALISTLHRRDAAKQLQIVFDRGTPEGKMYALVGLREISRERFERNIAQFADTRSIVTLATVEQGVLGREPAAVVLKRIENGAYTSFVRWALSRRPQR